MESACVTPIALSLREMLLPACEKIVICGGLRRKKAEVGDIDLVCLPKRDPDLFGTGTGACTAFHDALQKLLTTGVVKWIPGAKNGEKLKTFGLPVEGGLHLELYISTPDNHGYIVAIRTGPMEFSQALVTPTHRGGLLPPCLACIKGNVYRYPSFREAEAARKAEQPHKGILVPVPNEEAFFRVLGMHVPLPQNRDGNGAQRVQWLPGREVVKVWKGER